jgi:hypothetical protein
MSSGGRNVTGMPFPWITADIVGSGVGCGMWVGVGSTPLAPAPVQPVATVSRSATPTQIAARRWPD